MGQPTHRLPWEENIFNPTRQYDGARRPVPPALSLVNAQPSGCTVGASETQHEGEPSHAKEPMSPTLAQAVECLAKFFNPGKRTYPSKEDSDSFEVIEMAEVERESPLTEWPRQEPSKDCVTILPHLWGYQIYIPSKVLKSLKEQRLKERAAFISMQLQSQFDGVLSIALPGGNVVPVDNIRAETYIINCWDKIFTFAGGDGVILRASWLTPLVYDLETWEAEPSKVNEEAQKAEPRIKNPVRATSVDDMVMVG